MVPNVVSLETSYRMAMMMMMMMMMWYLFKGFKESKEKGSSIEPLFRFH